MKSLTEYQRIKIYMLSVRKLHSYNDECGVCIFPQKLDQRMKSQTPMYAFNILLRFNVMVRIIGVYSQRMRNKTKVLMASDKNRDLYTVLLHKQLGNIVFHVNKMKENRIKALDHLKMANRDESNHFDRSVFARKFNRSN